MANIVQGTECTKENARFLISLTDKELLKSLLSEFYGLSFKGSDCIENTSIKIQENREGEYWVHDFGSDSLGISNKNASWIFNKHKAQAQEYYYFEQGSPTTKKKIDLKTSDIQQNAAVLGYLSAKTGAGLDVLRAHHLNGCASAYGRKKAAAFCWEVNGTIKVRDTKSKAYKHLINAENKRGSYIFGLDQAQGKKLFLVGGETDVLCVNAFGGGEFSAACLLSETAILTKDIQNEILSKYAAQDVYILYDNDKTGINASAEAAHVSSFNLVDAAKLYSMYGGKNDICEAYSAYGGAGVLDLLRTAQKLVSTLKKNSLDKYSFDVQNTTFCDFNQYLTEPKPLSLLKYAIETDKRIIVQASAGGGKSYAGAELAAHALKIGLEGIIFLTPTKAITEQLGITLNEQAELINKRDALNMVVVSLHGKVSKDDIKSAEQASVIVSTYDKITTRLNAFINSINTNKYLIVIDEAHQIISDYGYRQEACSAIYDLTKRAKFCVLLSATPNLFFCTNQEQGLNFRLYKFEQKTTNKIRLQVISHKGKKSEVLSRVNEFKPTSKGGAHCVKLDNNTSLTAYKNKFGTERTLHYTSQKDNSEDVFYNEVMNNGGAGAEVETLLYTSLFEAGVSFKFSVSCISILDAKAAAKIIQHSTRPRMQNGVNENIFVNLFLTDSEPLSVKFKDVQKEFKRLVSKAAKAAQEAQKWQIGTIKHKRTSVDSKLFIKQNGEYWSVDVQAILYHLNQQETAAATSELIKLRIKRLDSRFEFCQDISINEAQDALKELIKAAKASKKEAQAAAVELMQKDVRAFLAATAYISKSAEFKAQVQSVLDIQQINKEVSKEFIEAQAAAFVGNYAKAAAQNICELCENGKTLAAAAKLVCNKSAKEVRSLLDNKTQKSRLNHLVRVAHGKEKELNGADTLQAKAFSMCRKKLDKVLDNANTGKRTNLLTAKNLQSIVNLCINSTIRQENIKTTNLKFAQNKTAAQALDFVRTIYKTEAKKVRINGKLETRYILIDRI